MKRAIKYIVLHCTATAHGTRVESIQKYWREHLKWKSPGYHVLIDSNGIAHQLLSYEGVANGVAGFNSQSIHISYVGGVKSDGSSFDNRTNQQKAVMLKYVKELSSKYPNAKICGHRDFPGVKKACPSFDVATWLKSEGFIK